MHRLMRVDAALISSDLDWLTTRAEKLAWLATHGAAEASEPPMDPLLAGRGDLLPGTFPRDATRTQPHDPIVHAPRFCPRGIRKHWATKGGMILSEATFLASGCEFCTEIGALAASSFGLIKESSMGDDVLH
jgi:hypothetical protein